MMGTAGAVSAHEKDALNGKTQLCVREAPERARQEAEEGSQEAAARGCQAAPGPGPRRSAARGRRREVRAKEIPVSRSDDLKRLALAFGCGLLVMGCAGGPFGQAIPERNDALFSRIAAGMAQDEVLRDFGRPDETMAFPMSR